MYVLQYLCALIIRYARPVEDGFNVGDNKKEDEIWNLLLHQRRSYFFSKCFVSQYVATGPLRHSLTAIVITYFKDITLYEIWKLT